MRCRRWSPQPRAGRVQSWVCAWRRDEANRPSAVKAKEPSCGVFCAGPSGCVSPLPQRTAGPPPQTRYRRSCSKPGVHGQLQPAYVWRPAYNLAYISWDSGKTKAPREAGPRGVKGELYPANSDSACAFRQRKGPPVRSGAKLVPDSGPATAFLAAYSPARSMARYQRRCLVRTQRP